MVKLFADLDNPVQENFLGLGAVYHGFAGQPDDSGRVYNKEQMELEYSRVRDMRLKVARTYYNWYPWDAKTGEWNWENERCQAFYDWCAKMKELGVTLAINVGWTNVGELQGDHWQGACPLKVEGNWDRTVKNYAKWVSETFYQLVIKRGFTNIKYFLIFTEPNERSYPTLPFEGADYRELWYQCARAAHEQLVRDGYRDKIKLLGPQEGISFRPWLNEWVWNEKHCEEFLDGGSMHNYLLFSEQPKSDIHSGKKSILIPHGYAQIQQPVMLRPHTDYTASIWLKSKISAEIKPNSRILFGVFGKGSFHHYFMDYCEPQDALFTLEVPASGLSTDEWRRFEFTFNSGEHSELNACVYSIINRTDGVIDKTWFHNGCLYNLYKDGTAVLCDDFEITENKNQIIKDPGFESSLHWYTFRCKPLCTDAYTTWLGYERDAIKTLPEKLKGDYWHDEYNSFVGSFKSGRYEKEHGVWLALGQVAQMNGGAKCSLLWALFDQQWPNDHRTTGDAFFDGEHRWGLMPCLLRGIKTPYPAYYAWCLVSRYTGGEGTCCFEGKNLSDEKVAFNVNRLPDGNYTVTAVNYGKTAVDANFAFSRSLNRTFYRHLFDSKTIEPDETATLPGIDKIFEDVADTITDTLPPMSVAVYTTLTD